MVIAVVLQRLLDDPSRVWSAEESLVLAALRRSTDRLADATPEQLATYLAQLNDEQLRGVVSNVKGIYHELLVRAAENSDGDGIIGLMPDATNQPGYDLEFVVDGDVIQTVQLKAVASPDQIYEHLARYPGIDVLATEEVAALVPGVDGSGYYNSALELGVRDAFQHLHGDSVAQELVDAAANSAFISAAFAARSALRAGRVDGRALKAAMGDLGVGLTTAFVLDLVINGGV